MLQVKISRKFYEKNIRHAYPIDIRHERLGILEQSQCNALHTHHKMGHREECRFEYSTDFVPQEDDDNTPPARYASQDLKNEKKKNFLTFV